jgi:magnesium transporter
MTNTLYLPELREMLAEHNTAELQEFCTALHPARTAEFMEGLTAAESWEVLQHTDPDHREQIFQYLAPEKQVEIIELSDRGAIAQLIASLPHDERVDILRSVSPQVVEELLPLLPLADRRDILRLRSYPEGTAGARMTTEVVRLDEHVTVQQANEEIRRQANELATNYLYVVDEEDHLRGVVSLRSLFLAPREAMIGDLMDRAVVAVHVGDDQEEVAHTLSHFDFQAIPVVDNERHLLGIVTFDDVIDVVRQEATEDAQRIGGVMPLQEGYLATPIRTLSWKRGVWLSVLFAGSLSTAFALNSFQGTLNDLGWLVLFIPLVISTGGNSGSQSATLVISALSTGDLHLADWARVVRRELISGLLLGSFLGCIGYGLALVMAPDRYSALVIPATLTIVVTAGTMVGATLPLLFRRLGLDPALMSTPFVASIVDIVGIVVYLGVATMLLE